jgi:peptide/nickel transport system substrate-binding protein
MRKTLSLILALAMLLTMASFASAEEMTDVGTPRADTLIVEFQSPIATPGQFNPYMSGTSKGSGLHQMLFDHLWEMDTVKGEQFPALAEDFPTMNEEQTEHVFHIRQGIAWSDGEPFTAHDVVYTIKAVLANDNIGQSTYWNTVFADVEAVDDYTVKVTTKSAFPRLAQKFGVTVWGNDLVPLPEHIFKDVEDISTFTYPNPLSLTQYKYHSHDELGNWILFEKREDFDKTASYMITEHEAVPQYVEFRVLGADETKMMEMVANKVDIMCEVTPELLEGMTAQNDKIQCWYKDYPYATMDDPCSKGITFSMGQGEPYSNKYFRWGLALALNMVEVSQNIFDGIGRASVLLTPATLAMHNSYYTELQPWLEEFTIEGTDIKPYDNTYPFTMAKLYNIEGTDEELQTMFGYGVWKYDPEAATTLLEMAGLEKKDDGWYYNGEPFSFTVNTISGSEAQAVRGGEAAVDQWKKFGLNCEVVSLISTSFSDAESQGTFTVGAYWPSCGIIDDHYDKWNGWDIDLIVPVGEVARGNGERWANQEFSDKLHELEKETDPAKIHEICTDMLKIAVDDLPFIGFHSGTKFVPTNSTYWTNYPTADNPYDGPWWWWSTFTYIMPYFEKAE